MTRERTSVPSSSVPKPVSPGRPLQDGIYVDLVRPLGRQELWAYGCNYCHCGDRDQANAYRAGPPEGTGTRRLAFPSADPWVEAPVGHFGRSLQDDDRQREEQDYPLDNGIILVKHGIEK